MIPLSIAAQIRGAIAMPHGPIALDALLAYAVVMRDRIPFATSPDEIQPIEIPVQREPCGRFHLASCAVYTEECHENRWINRRFPVQEAQMLGDRSVRRVGVTGGPGKSYRLPLDTMHLVGDTLRWWCIGEIEPIRELLGLIWYLGKKRSTGLGHVISWDVSPCETWPGFPVVLAGRPLRHLPPDWPGLVDPDIAIANITYPYQVQLNPNETVCAVP